MISDALSYLRSWPFSSKRTMLVVFTVVSSFHFFAKSSSFKPARPPMSPSFDSTSIKSVQSFDAGSASAEHLTTNSTRSSVCPSRISVTVNAALPAAFFPPLSALFVSPPSSSSSSPFFAFLLFFFSASAPAMSPSRYAL